MRFSLRKRIRSRWGTGRSGTAPGGTQFGDEAFDFRIGLILPQELFDVTSGVGKQDFEDEIYGSGGAFDVEEEGADFR